MYSRMRKTDMRKTDTFSEISRTFDMRKSDTIAKISRIFVDFLSNLVEFLGILVEFGRIFGDFLSNLVGFQSNFCSFTSGSKTGEQHP